MTGSELWDTYDTRIHDHDEDLLPTSRLFAILTPPQLAGFLLHQYAWNYVAIFALLADLLRDDATASNLPLAARLFEARELLQEAQRQDQA